jgi:hypothetical protein
MAEFLSRERDGRWAVSRLTGNCCRLDGSPLDPAQTSGAGKPVDSFPIVCRIPDLNDWVILVPGDISVYINGRAIGANIRVLQDHDQVRVDDREPVFFSAREQIVVEVYPDHLEPVTCARCGQPVQSGQSIVRCPMCRIAVHEEPGIAHACWSYTDTCPNPYCNQATAMDGREPEWTPEDYSDD